MKSYFKENRKTKSYNLWRNMFQYHNCFFIVQKTRPLFSNTCKIRKSKLGSVRCFFKKQTNEPNVQKEKIVKPALNDEKYSDFFLQYLFSLEMQKQSYANFLNECKKFRKELEEDYVFNNFRYDKADHKKIYILHKFEKPEDLEGYRVYTDSSFNRGYSSASFKLTENETAIFSGNICLDVPKSGMGTNTGFANLSFPKQYRSFFRIRPYDFSQYNHLVLKVRGDGRVYAVFLHTPYKYEEVRHSMYCHQLFTRGGPYWQIVKIPFYHFFFSLNGKAFDLQSSNIPLSNIEKLSITASAYEGPFKLEIDYVGLEYIKYQKHITPYEQYRMK